MNPDRETIRKKVDSQLDADLARKSPRLSKRLRAGIRRMKQSGELDRAAEIAREARKRRGGPTIQELARFRLFRTANEILDGDQPEMLVEKQIEAVWLMKASGMLNYGEKTDELLQIIEASQEAGLDQVVGNKLTEVRDKLENMIPGLRF